jgi:three-Cys-motif partner protein
VDAYVESQDDGLPMRPAGPWAAEKLDYLRRYIGVFESSMRGKWQLRNYIDLLAGPGKNQVETTGDIFLGSPLLALTTAVPFTGYYLVEYDAKNAAALRTRVLALPHQESIAVLEGDCNQLVKRIIDAIRPDDSRSLNLAFLDPEGMELEWGTVARLASLRRCDLIINYPQGGLNRVLKQASSNTSQTSVDEFFGDRGWRRAFEESQEHGDPTPHLRLIDYYCARLKSLGYGYVRRDDEVGDEPLMRNAKRRAPLYRLLFASKHPLGHNFWHSITRRDVHRQQLLFRG